MGLVWDIFLGFGEGDPERARGQARVTKAMKGTS